MKKLATVADVLALIGISQENLNSYGITEDDTTSTIGENLKSIMHSTSGGRGNALPIGKLEFYDNGPISSAVESNIMEIVRNTAEADGTSANISGISSEIREKMAPWEQSAYDTAVRLKQKALIKSFEKSFNSKYGGKTGE